MPHQNENQQKMGVKTCVDHHAPSSLLFHVLPILPLDKFEHDHSVSQASLLDRLVEMLDQIGALWRH